MYKTLLFLSIFVFTISCSKDENLSAKTVVIGSWELTSLEYSGSTELTDFGPDYTTTFSGVAKEIDMTIEFDQTTYVSSGGYVIEITSEVAGQTSVTDFPVSGWNGSGSYTIEGDLITITSIGQPDSEATISVIDNNNIKLSTSIDMIDNVSGFERRVVLDQTLGFRKVN